MNKLPLAARAVWLALALSLAGAMTGCKVPASLTKPSEEEQREIDRKRELPTEVACLVVEYDYLHQEVQNPRKEPFDRVAFDYVSSEALPAAVAKSAPTHVFVIAHGWMNNAISAQGFTSALMGFLWLGGNLILIVGLLTTLFYFFFSTEHRGFSGTSARIGIYFLMISFGASYGFTVMARISLALDRLRFLFDDWLGLPIIS